MVRYLPTLLILTGTASAQCLPEDPLSVAETGQAAVGSCYSACMARLQEHTDRIADTVLNYASSGASVEDVESFACASRQQLLVHGDACAAGCRDVETAYGSIDSEAETIFNQAFTEAKSEAQATGLYTDAHTYPSYESVSFELACESVFLPDLNLADDETE